MHTKPARTKAEEHPTPHADGRVSLRPVRASDGTSLCQRCFPDQRTEDVLYYLDWCLKQARRGRMVRLVAEVDGQVVGQGELAIHRRQGEIGSLIVSPSHRRQGIGRALLRALIDAARERDLARVEIAASREAPWTEAWYEREGFAPSPGRACGALRMVLQPG
jgi:GNAT superfamily N-acetyltransferase